VEHLATELPDLCASEAELFERLLGTRVERETTIVDGAVRCETRIDLGPRTKRPANRLSTSPNLKAARSSV
jgi:predicted ArsR family transcriptional regulator